jgi:hypothetical protein
MRLRSFQCLGKSWLTLTALVVVSMVFVGCRDASSEPDAGGGAGGGVSTSGGGAAAGGSAGGVAGGSAGGAAGGSAGGFAGGSGGGTAGGNAGGGTAGGSAGGVAGGSAGGAGNAVGPLYPSANPPMWNEWVVNDGPDPFSATGVACNFMSMQSTRAAACVHSSELRVFRAPSLTSCSGVSVSDALGAFDWQCDLDAGAVRVRSVSLKAGKGLTDLVDFTPITPAFRPNSVTITSGATTVTSASTTWWANPFVVPTASGFLRNANRTSNTIFAIRQNQQNLFTIDQPMISFVIAPGAALSTSMPPQSLGTLLSVTAPLGPVWVEGTFDATLVGFGLSMTQAPFSRVRNVEVRGATTMTSLRPSLSTGVCNNCDVRDVRVRNNEPGGLACGGDFIRVRNVFAEGNGVGNSAVSIGTSGSVDQRISDVVSINNHDGFFIGTSDVDVRHVVTANNRATGFFVNENSIAARVRVHDVRSLHNAGPGVLIRGINSVWTDITAIGNGGGIGLSNTPNGIILVGAVSSANGGPGLGGAGFVDQVTHLIKDSTFADNAGNGVELNRDAHTVNNVVMANNGTGVGSCGYSLQGGSVRSHHVAVHDNGTTFRRDLVITNTNPSIPHVFSGILQVSDATASCSAWGVPFAPRGLTNLCANAPTVLSDGGLVGSTASLLQTSLPYWTFSGRVLTGGMGDSANQSDDTGAAALASITDWHRFDNRFRGWGRAQRIGPDTPNPYDGGIAFYGWPSVQSRGACFGTSAVCEVFDYSLRGIQPPDAGPGAGGATDVYLRNKLATPTSGMQAITHVFRGFLLTQANCTDLPGATWNTATMRCSVTFLENAQEVLEDGVGNENGLCESSERCVVTRNFGAYQGHGALLPDSTIGGGGPIQNVMLLRYELNGR